MAQTKMFSPSHIKTLHSHHQPFSVKPSQPSSSLTSTKIKNLLHTLIVSQVCRIIRALSKVKAAIIEIIKDNRSNIHFLYPSKKKRGSNTKKIIMGSFRLHYNWCSSRSSRVIMPVPTRVFEGLPKAAGSDKWNTVILSEQQGGEDFHDLELAGYLQWLEEKVHEDDKKEKEIINEIDMLAEMFIANCHEKFRLEKQESDRKFHEMLARGL
ncbi:hypothetical protein SESBI_12440 [Sesbania bispinosa]|nr:hypothetical protein SESBI_12440 [Sesbania bispinosa]